ncbi:hypothetical protein SUGI_1498090 [Cryptomeria japonica]|uniref:Uncharacterized protein n=1 Tax=Cryptomeria japonica TaxID=3369 RepID=A0AAD3NPM3_CRYJA|nr:hypothetical protein SUGI_1223270 [Cryptomeria japonica]GLJ59229.1 hypothetical protein SUGI_1498090 [Cryptomeria japonica]
MNREPSDLAKMRGGDPKYEPSPPMHVPNAHTGKCTTRVAPFPVPRRVWGADTPARIAGDGYRIGGEEAKRTLLENTATKPAADQEVSSPRGSPHFPDLSAIALIRPEKARIPYYSPLPVAGDSASSGFRTGAAGYAPQTEGNAASRRNEQDMRGFTLSEYATYPKLLHCSRSESPDREKMAAFGLDYHIYNENRTINEGHPARMPYSRETRRP